MSSLYHTSKRRYNLQIELHEPHFGISGVAVIQQFVPKELRSKSLINFDI